MAGILVMAQPEDFEGLVQEAFLQLMKGFPEGTTGLVHRRDRQRQSRETRTLLRKVASKSREEKVWIDCKTTVGSGDMITALGYGGDWMWVRTSKGAEGLIRSEHVILASEAETMYQADAEPNWLQPRHRSVHAGTPSSEKGKQEEKGRAAPRPFGFYGRCKMDMEPN